MRSVQQTLHANLLRGARTATGSPVTKLRPAICTRLTVVTKRIPVLSRDAALSKIPVPILHLSVCSLPVSRVRGSELRVAERQAGVHRLPPWAAALYVWLHLPHTVSPSPAEVLPPRWLSLWSPSTTTHYKYPRVNTPALLNINSSQWLSYDLLSVMSFLTEQVLCVFKPQIQSCFVLTATW